MFQKIYNGPKKLSKQIRNPTQLIILGMIFVENDNFYILVEFESDQIGPRESVKNGRNGAHGLNCKIFVNFEHIYEINDEKYHMKKNSSLNESKRLEQTMTLFKFLKFSQISRFQMKILAKFYQPLLLPYFSVVFGKDDVLYILVEFESDRLVLGKVQKMDDFAPTG